MTWLAPCPGCGINRKADEGHHLCRECEGYTTPDPNEHPYWCKCQRVCGGDQ